MGQNLYWQPVRPSEGKTLTTGLKWAFQRQHLRDKDGRVRLTEEDVAFLRGVIAASGSDTAMQADAETLIEAIEKYGAVEIWVA